MLITDAAVRETAVTLAQNLGGDWTLDPEAPADGAAHLIYSDGRAISFRPIFGGATVQLWITGNAAPPLPDDATPADRAAHEARIGARLPEGHRYNTATTLVTEEEEDPAVIILRTLEDLLPAFECKPRYVGHRPWRDLFDNALAAVTAERSTQPATTNPGDEADFKASEPEPGPEVEPVVEPEPGPEVEPVVEPEPEAEVEPRPEVSPATEEEPQSQGPADDGHADGASVLAAEPSREDDGPGGDARPEAAPVDNAGDQGGGQAGVSTNRRPRKRAPKRRPKTSTT
ncbi:hypothetical protein [Streptomyces sp. NPDC048385]|uniref:hypothetical protein n=1 Tax=Streptomyces sp. NPDC048385 TaxID=3155145 RepID=UPI003429D008